MSDPTQHPDDAAQHPENTPVEPTSSDAPAAASDAQPTAEQPTAEQPATEQPVSEQPTAEQPTAEQPTTEYPTMTYPTAPVGSPRPGDAPVAAAVPVVPADTAADTGTAPAGTTTATKERRRGIAVPVIVALIVGAVLGGASGAGVAALVSNNGNGQQQSSSGNPQTITINDSGDVNAVTAIAKKASPSVVTINVTAGQQAGTGSGVILSADGYVLTNTHVVTLDGQSGSGTVEVTTYDGKLYKATVVGTDPIVDLAVVKLQNASGLTPIEFGDSSKLNVGDRVVAIGAPLGLSNTVTDGIVSALNRSIQIASSAAPSTGSGDSNNGGSGSSPFNFWNFGNGSGGSGSSGSTTQTSEISLPVIQTDAAINPGNSGGALVDDSGKLVGVNVAIASTGSTTSTSSQSGSIGVGFAIPADLAQRIGQEIIKTGKGTHGLLGASVTDATADNSSTVGAMIESVTSGGAADKAGLQKGDVVTQLNGLPITDATDLTAQVRALAPGSDAKLTYERGGKASTVDVTLGSLSS